MAQNQHDYILAQILDGAKRDRTQGRIGIHGHVEARGQLARVAHLTSLRAIDRDPSEWVILLLVRAAEEPETVSSRVPRRTEVLEVFFHSNVLGDGYGLA